MRPRQPASTDTHDLFRHRLENLLDQRHELVRLAGILDWERFDETFGALYCPVNGCPGKATRLMVGLEYLKHLHGLSDEAVVARWVENPYWQYSCGEEYFQHRPPIDPSSLTRFRRRIGASGCEEILKATIDAGLGSGTVKPGDLGRVTVDTTVQDKAVAFPTDGKLLNRSRVRLVKLFGETSEKRILPEGQTQEDLLALLGKKLPAPPAPETETIPYERKKPGKPRDHAVNDSGLRFDDTAPVETIHLPLAPEAEAIPEDRRVVVGEKVTFRLAQHPANYVILRYVRPVIKEKPDPERPDGKPARLVHAHHRESGIVGAPVYIQYLLHRGDKLGVPLGRNHPTDPPPRFEFVFFRTRRTVSWDTASM